MRVRGGFGRLFAPAVALGLAMVLTGCSGSNAEPQDYELTGGDAKPARIAAASSEPSAADFAQRAGDVVYFKGDSAELSPAAKATLRKQVRWLNRHKEIHVVVEGHADEWGTLQHNLSLGAERAVAVKTYLRQNGLQASRVHTVSFGKERRVADCTALTCRAQNRRARTVISPPG